MTDVVAREFVEQILSQAILRNWKFYVLLFSLSFVGTFFGSLIASYARKKGEALATRADFAQLLMELRQTTRAAEETRAAVQHSDWISREWKTLRRTKLEVLLETTYSG